MLEALKAVQGKRHLRLRLEKSYKLLKERNWDGSLHEALSRVSQLLDDKKDIVTN